MFDIPGIPRELIEHSLDILPNAQPIKKRMWRFGDQKRKAIDENIHLLVAKFIKEEFHPNG